MANVNNQARKQDSNSGNSLISTLAALAVVVVLLFVVIGYNRERKKEASPDSVIDPPKTTLTDEDEGEINTATTNSATVVTATTATNSATGTKTETTTETTKTETTTDKGTGSDKDNGRSLISILQENNGQVIITTNPNELKSILDWTDEDKFKRPVEYHKEVLNYLKEREDAIKITRNCIGVTKREWERKVDEAHLEVIGVEEILKEAAERYRQAEAKNEWPVSFPYHTDPLDKRDFQDMIIDYSEKLQRSKKEEIRLNNGYTMLKDSLRKHDKGLELLAEQIRNFSNNLELLQSGTLTNETTESIKEMDKAFAESEQMLTSLYKDLQTTLFIDRAIDNSEVNMSLEAILNRYAPLD